MGSQPEREDVTEEWERLKEKPVPSSLEAHLLEALRLAKEKRAGLREEHHMFVRDPLEKQFVAGRLWEAGRTEMLLEDLLNGHGPFLWDRY